MRGSNDDLISQKANEPIEPNYRILRAQSVVYNNQFRVVLVWSKKKKKWGAAKSCETYAILSGAKAEVLCVIRMERIGSIGI